MKVVNNLIILALIGLLSSTYLFNLSPIDYRGTIEIETPVETSTLSLEVDDTKNLLNPESIVIKHISEKDEVIKSITDNIFNAKVYENDIIIKENIDNLEYVSPTPDTTYSINKENPMISTLDISQKNLGLDDGTYKVVIESNLISDPDKSKIILIITYDTGGNYYTALNEAPVGKKGLTLYFTTEKYDTLIPVTRFVVEDKSITRMAIEQLQNGPSDTGLKTVIGDINNTTYNNGNVLIDIPGDYEDYNNGSLKSNLSHSVLVKTIFAVDRYWPIHSVNFTVNRKSVNEYFNNINTQVPLPNKEENYLLYLAYRINDRYYLFDTKIDTASIGINENDSIDIKVKKLFDAYSDIDLGYGRNPIDKNVYIQGVKLEGKILVLDFNKEFYNSYKNKEDLKLMMIESMIYTFTSIPNIDGIKITVNNEPLKNFIKDRDLTGVLYPPEFINPEIIQ